MVKIFIKNESIIWDARRFIKKTHLLQVHEWLIKKITKSVQKIFRSLQTPNYKTAKNQPNVNASIIRNV